MASRLSFIGPALCLFTLAAVQTGQAGQTGMPAAPFGCGARTGLLVPEDAGTDSSCQPIPDRCGRAEICGNGEDDDCNGKVDDGCSCTPGSVQSCFAGPPGRRHVGVCSDGQQNCELSGRWGACTGGIVPRADVCNGADNSCNGCSQQNDCPIRCPSPGDVRTPDGKPFVDYPLRGGDFYEGAAKSWRWTVKGGPCDDVSKQPSFLLKTAGSQNATFFPRLSGDYTVSLTVVTINGTTLTCSWIVHVGGPGLRVEMCYPESEKQDLDLMVHKPGSTMPWYPTGPSITSFDPNPDACGWFNCEAHIRKTTKDGKPVPRADWGYEKSPIAECVNGPYGDEWKDLGFCANPRLDLDNNLDEGVGIPENINVDLPHDGDVFRVMVQNFTGKVARPLINVYCAGRRVATYGAPPDELKGFEGTPGANGVGAMWRVCDVAVKVDSSGKTTSCTVSAVHPPGRTAGYDVTFDDPRY